MQRGQGRGRRGSSLSNQSVLDRRNRSNPPSTTQEQSSSQGSASQLGQNSSTSRRSARPAESLSSTTYITQRSTASTEPMADVARPRALGSQSVRSRHHNGSARRSDRPRSGLYSDDIQYAMDFIVQPPRTARVGHTMPGSIIVRLRTTNTHPDDALADSPNLVAVAALVPGPNSTAPSDPDVLNTLLAGQRVDTIHPFADDEADGSIASMDMAGSQGVGYMRFPDLVVRQAGTYRIRITLLRIRTSDPSGGSTSVQVIDSNPIVVQNGGSATSYASYNGKCVVTSY